MKKKSVIMTILFGLLLPAFWLLIVHTNNKPPTPYQGKNMETLKTAQRGDLVICTVHTSPPAMPIKRAMFVTNNDKSVLQLHGYGLDRWTIHTHHTRGLPYQAFDGCEVSIQKYEYISRELIGSIILDGLAR